MIIIWLLIIVYIWWIFRMVNSMKSNIKFTWILRAFTCTYFVMQNLASTIYIPFGQQIEVAAHLYLLPVAVINIGLLYFYQILKWYNKMLLHFDPLLNRCEHLNSDHELKFCIPIQFGCVCVWFSQLFHFRCWFFFFFSFHNGFFFSRLISPERRVDLMKYVLY